MPKTMLNCVMATSRPRYAAGEISAMYIGETTEAPPIARPPMNRKNRNEAQFHGNAQPSAETKYSTAIDDQHGPPAEACRPAGPPRSSRRSCRSARWPR